MSRNCVVIVAAGQGKRMSAGVNKLLLNLRNKPILAYTLEAFEQSRCIDEIVLVTAEHEMEYCKNEIIGKYNIQKVSKIVAGGSERNISVYNGLKAVEACDIILIHDGARPFVSEEIIEQGIHYAKLYGACTCGVTPKDTIKVKDEQGFSVETPNRNSLFSVQTPQCFDYKILLECHERISREKFAVTDDTMAVERYGYKVFLYEGSYKNIKITTPEDLFIGEKFLEIL